MTRETVKLEIPFEALANAVKALSWENQLRLWELLEEQMAQAEEKQWEQAPAVQAEIQEARVAYRSGDYVTIDEYIARQNEQV